MTQFLKFDKVTTQTVSKTSPIIINREALLVIEEETVLDRELGTHFIASRVTVTGYPEHTFYTPTRMSVIEAALSAVDATGVITTGGNQCSDPGAVSIVTISTQLPILKLNRIVNNIASLTSPFLCNPNFILYAEEAPFQDELTEAQSTWLMVVLKGQPMRRIPTKLTFSQLSGMLEPIAL